MQRLLIALVVLTAVFGMLCLSAEAGFVTGAPSGSIIAVGGDIGNANQVDSPGDIVASYTSGAMNDTAFRTTLGSPDTVSVKAIFGDTTEMIGTDVATIAPAGQVTFTITLKNWANQSDAIRIDNDTPTGGASKDSITIRANGVVIYQGGVPDTFAPLALPPIPSGAETQVTIQVTHQDTNGGLGSATIKIKAIANAGLGGDPGGYVGNNGDKYAGAGDDTEILTVTVNVINVVMSVSQDPILVPATYNGPAGDSIPGSQLTYVIRYDNDGNDTAVGYTVHAHIPANSVMDSVLTPSSHSGSTATITILSDTGDVVSVNSPNATRIRWTFSTGVGPNNGDPVNVVDASVSDIDAGILKFRVFIK